MVKPCVGAVEVGRGRTVVISPERWRALRKESRRVTRPAEQDVPVARLLELLLTDEPIFRAGEEASRGSRGRKRRLRKAIRRQRAEEKAKREQHRQSVAEGRPLILKTYAKLVDEGNTYPRPAACRVVADKLRVPLSALPFEFCLREWLRAPHWRRWYTPHPKETRIVFDNGWPGADPTPEERPKLKAKRERAFARDVEIERRRLSRLLERSGLKSLADVCEKHGRPILECDCDAHVRNHGHSGIASTATEYRRKLLKAILAFAAAS